MENHLFTHVNYQAKHPNMEKPMDYGWVLKLSTPKDVEEYFLADKEFEKSFRNLVFVESQKRIYNCNVHQGSTLSVIADSLSKFKGTNLFVEFGELFLKKISVIIDLQKKHGVVYVNAVGGCFIPTENGIELKTVQTENIVYKHTKPKYIKWPNGEHWYVKVWNMDVVVNGEQKWNTKKEAEIAFGLWEEEFGNE